MDANNDSLKENFKEVIYDSCKSLGLDDLPPRIISILQSESDEISLGKLAEMSGYSLSTLSTVIRGMEDLNMVKRFKKTKIKETTNFYG